VDGAVAVATKVSERHASGKFAAIDDDGALIGLFDSRDAAAGACQDAAREADSDGQGYEVLALEAGTDPGRR